VPGRPAIDPRLLVALWLYGTLSGFTSACELDRMCAHYEPLLWLAGGVSVNAHTLADFHTHNPQFRESLLQHSVDVLRRRGAVDLDRVAQDGVRVRASAGSGSFHRHETLTRQLREAKAELRALRPKRAAKRADPTPPTGVAATDEPKRSAQQQAAAVRQAEDRVDRVEAALERMPEMDAKIPPGSTKEPRVSTTEETDHAEVSEWRARMGTDEAKEIYKQRAATAECVNAQARNRGLGQFQVRGLDKVKAAAEWFAITHNMARSFALPNPTPVIGYP
jgi:hypothetical protein